jgi:hypothetical protein
MYEIQLLKSVTSTIVTEEYVIDALNIQASRRIVDGAARPFVLTANNTPPHLSDELYVWRINLLDNTKSFSEIHEEVNATIDNLYDLDKSNLYFAYTAGGVLFDTDFNPIPLRHDFDYVGTPFHNGLLNLSKAIEVLREHPWVLNKEELEIEDIPYYNSDDERNQYISVSVLPDKDTYTGFYNSVIGENYWSVRLNELLHDGYCPDKRHNIMGLLRCVK